MASALFYILAAIATASAVGVVVTRSLVRSSVCLLFTLMAVAGLYFLLDAEFLAAVQLVVYTGGILILIIFGVLLTSSSVLVRYDPKPGEVAVAAVTTALLLSALVVLAAGSEFKPAAATPVGTVDQFGQALVGDYVLPFELSGVLLLVVLIGAAYIARGRRSEGGSGRGGEGETNRADGVSGQVLSPPRPLAPSPTLPLS